MSNECGCKINFEYDETYDGGWDVWESECEIEYCDLHKAAPEMLALLEEVWPVIDGANVEDDCGSRMFNLIRLARGEQKEDTK